MFLLRIRIPDPAAGKRGGSYADTLRTCLRMAIQTHDVETFILPSISPWPHLVGPRGGRAPKPGLRGARLAKILVCVS